MTLMSLVMLSHWAPLVSVYIRGLITQQQLRRNQIQTRVCSRESHLIFNDNHSRTYLDFCKLLIHVCIVFGRCRLEENIIAQALVAYVWKNAHSLGAAHKGLCLCFSCSALEALQSMFGSDNSTGL